MSYVLRALLDHEGPHSLVNTPNGYGWYPLHVLAGDSDDGWVRPWMIQQLVQARADVEAKDNKGGTPLHKAAEGETELVRVLIDSAKCSIEYKNPAGDTALICAITYASALPLLRSPLTFFGSRRAPPSLCFPSLLPLNAGMTTRTS